MLKLRKNYSKTTPCQKSNFKLLQNYSLFGLRFGCDFRVLRQLLGRFPNALKLLGVKQWCQKLLLSFWAHTRIGVVLGNNGRGYSRCVQMASKCHKGILRVLLAHDQPRSPSKPSQRQACWRVLVAADRSVPSNEFVRAWRANGADGQDMLRTRAARLRWMAWWLPCPEESNEQTHVSSWVGTWAPMTTYIPRPTRSQPPSWQDTFLDMLLIQQPNLLKTICTRECGSSDWWVSELRNERLSCFNFSRKCLTEKRIVLE